ncbi:hypothetical protein LBMAG57_02950 [Verrucomicrobiota bacterium]|nr:hypothetical protein LBMAG57_02950 [Verrucomicrobiota bacterium]
MEADAGIAHGGGVMPQPAGMMVAWFAGSHGNSVNPDDAEFMSEGRSGRRLLLRAPTVSRYFPAAPLVMGAGL